MEVTITRKGCTMLIIMGYIPVCLVSTSRADLPMFVCNWIGGYWTWYAYSQLGEMSSDRGLYVFMWRRTSDSVLYYYTLSHWSNQNTVAHWGGGSQLITILLHIEIGTPVKSITIFCYCEIRDPSQWLLSLTLRQGTSVNHSSLSLKLNLKLKIIYWTIWSITKHIVQYLKYTNSHLGSGRLLLRQKNIVIS